MYSVGKVPCNNAKYNITQHRTVHMPSTRLYTPEHSNVYITAKHSTAQYNRKYNITQHSTAQHSTAQHSTAQHSTAQHSTAHMPSTLYIEHRLYTRAQQLLHHNKT
jgi:hypothetical protein